MKNPTKLLLILLLLSAMLTGCGGQDAPETGTTSQETTVSQETPAVSQEETTGEPEPDVVNREVVIGLNYTITAAAGAYSAKSSRFATESYLDLQEFDKISISSPYKMTWIAYDADYKYLGNSGAFLGESRKWLNVGEVILSATVRAASKDARYIRVAVCSTSSSSAFTVRDIIDSGFAVTPSEGFGYELSLPGTTEYRYKNLLTGAEAVFKAEFAGVTSGYQDGAAYGNYLFRFANNGEYSVYALDNSFETVFSGLLDQADYLVPHSNAVFFGTKKYSAEDEFPLLYCNIYNTYKNETDKKEGLLCVYRVLREGNTFTTELVQLIRIGFVSERGVWRSKTGTDERPYGNFVCDEATGTLYAFVPADVDKVTRLFAFDMPDVSKSTEQMIVGRKKIGALVLSKDDIKDSVDLVYIAYPQGATVIDGILYSLEGFDTSSTTKSLPYLKAFSIASKQLICDIPLAKCGLTSEPELITGTSGNGILFSDITGAVYKLNTGIG